MEQTPDVQAAVKVIAALQDNAVHDYEKNDE